MSNARRQIFAALAILALAACGGAAGPAAAHSPAHVSAPHRATVHTTARARLHNACTASSRSAHVRLASHRCPSAKRAAPRHRVAAPAAQGATIASVLATSCQNTELTPEAGNLPLVREAVLCLINRVRAQHGESPLQANADLERAAEEHGGELVADDYFAHVAPNGTTPVDRVRATGYIPGPRYGYVIGENLAWGTLSLSTPQSIVSAWVASPGHLANILEAQYRDTGVGVTAAVPSSLGGGQQGATYVQEFGVIID